MCSNASLLQPLFGWPEIVRTPELIGLRNGLKLKLQSRVNPKKKFCGCFCPSKFAKKTDKTVSKAFACLVAFSTDSNASNCCPFSLWMRPGVLDTNRQFNRYPLLQLSESSQNWICGLLYERERERELEWSELNRPDSGENALIKHHCEKTGRRCCAVHTNLRAGTRRMSGRRLYTRADWN